MKNEAQLKEVLQNLVGKTVEFLPAISTTELNFEEGMRARVVKLSMAEYSENDNESLIKIWFDFGSFAEFNRTRQSANFFDKNSKPCLTWEQYAPEEFHSKEKMSYFSNDFEKMFKVVGLSEEEAHIKLAEIMYAYTREDGEDARAAKGIIEKRKEIQKILSEIA